MVPWPDLRFWCWALIVHTCFVDNVETYIFAQDLSIDDRAVAISCASLMLVFLYVNFRHGVCKFVLSHRQMRTRARGTDWLSGWLGLNYKSCVCYFSASV